MSRVLVTGAAGFVGVHVCRNLRRNGFEVRATVRDEAGSMEADELRIVGDIAIFDRWDDVVSGCDTVVHLAARVHQIGENPELAAGAYRQVNVEATRRLAQSAIDAGVRRFVLVSTLHVLGEASSTPLREDISPAPLSPYALSKLEAENALHDACRSARMEWVILRPPLIYGPGVLGNLERLIRLVDRGWPLPFGAVKARRHLVSVLSLADAVRLAVSHSNARGQAFVVADEASVTLAEIVSALAAGLDRKAAIWTVPLPILRGMARVVGRDRDLEKLAAPLLVDSSKIRRLLGWSDQESPWEGLKNCAAEFRRNRDRGTTAARGA